MIRKQESPLELVSVQRIWDLAPHNAFTDLYYFQERWFCTFRESDTHAKGINGKIRIITSNDGREWRSIALIEEGGIDLRDPKLSVDPNGLMMLLVGGLSLDRQGKYLSMQSRVAFSSNGADWTPFKLILSPHEWLWRVTWRESNAYGVSYRHSDPTRRQEPWLVDLYHSTNGVDYHLITNLDIPGHPNETTVQFCSNGDMVALMRRDNDCNDEAWIGVSKFPYINWSWSPTRFYFGGPNFLILSDGSMWAAGRILIRHPYGLFAKTAIASMGFEHLQARVYLPSWGDTCCY